MKTQHLKYLTCKSTSVAIFCALLMATSVVQSQQAPVSVDSLQWLEQPQGKQALAWAKDQTESTVKRLSALPNYGLFKSELDATLQSNPPEPAITLIGHKAIRFLITKDQPYGRLQVASRNATGVPGQWRTVLDVAALRKREGVPYELQAYQFDKSCLPPGFERCLLRLSPSGSDEVQIREFDLNKADFVKGGFSVSTSRSFATWLNKDTLLVATADKPEHKTMTGWPTNVQLWHRGQALGAAPVIYQAKTSDALIQLDAAGSGASRYGVLSRAIDYSHFETYLVHQDGSVEQVALPTDALKAMGVEASNAKAVYYQFARDTEVAGKQYAAESVVAYNADPKVPKDQRLSLVYAPASGEYIEGWPFGVVATANQVVFTVEKHLVPQIMAATPNGSNWAINKIVQAAPGTAVTVATDPLSDDINVTTTGFVTPTRQELYRSGEAAKLLAEDKSLIDGSKYVTEIDSVTSKDGTSVDYFLLKPRAPTFKGPQPLLVTGYAAFGISVKPSYFDALVGGPAMKLWLERGGSLVIPAARGGGERGEAWHKAAMREHRQNSYDDFIAVIEHLVQTGYTTAPHIGIFGSSNGGLLAAVMETERPDLFGAIVSDVPLTDLVRLKYMGMGAAWLDEYGDASDPKMRGVIDMYSPLQNVRNGVKYPPFLVTTSTADDRVGPGHARKFAARLESVGAPVYFYEADEGGHGVSDSFRNSQLMALRMTFFIDNLMGTHQ